MDGAIQIVTEPSNHDMTLGALVQAFKDMQEANTRDHKKIFERLDEGDQYLAVLKISGCAFSFLTKSGIVKYAIIGASFMFLDWLSRYFYWDIFPKP